MRIFINSNDKITRMRPMNESGLCDDERLGHGHLTCLCENFKALDRHLSERLAVCVSHNSSGGSYRYVMKIIEWVAHGLPWVIGPLAFILLNVRRVFFLNIFLGIVLDMIAVVVLKVLVRRARPSYNIMDMQVPAPGDQFSFPSGHASRSSMLAYIFVLNANLQLFGVLVLSILALAVGISRVMLGRHYLTDVISGLLLGVIEGIFVSAVWLPAVPYF